MNGFVVFVVGTGAIITYAIYSASGYDPTHFNMSREEVQRRISESVVTYPSYNGEGNVTIRGTGNLSQNAGMSVDYSDERFDASCAAKIVDVDDDTVKVVADCSGSGTQVSDFDEDMRLDLRTITFNEFIQSTLRNRAYDPDVVSARVALKVMDKMPEIQNEALRRQDEAQGLQSRSYRQ